MKFTVTSIISLGIFSLQTRALPNPSCSIEGQSVMILDDDSAPDNSTLNPNCVSGGYATFYDDHYCHDNKGHALGLDNGACLANEPGRHSVYVQSPCYYDQVPRIVMYQGSNCDCQNWCIRMPDQFLSNNGCFDLGDHPSNALSFRWVQQQCADNQC